MAAHIEFILAIIGALGAPLAYFRIDHRVAKKFVAKAGLLERPTGREKVMLALSLASLVLCALGFYSLSHPKNSTVERWTAHNARVQAVQEQSLLWDFNLKKLPWIDQFPLQYPFGQELQADFVFPAQGKLHIYWHIEPVRSYMFRPPISIENNGYVDQSQGGMFSWSFFGACSRGKAYSVSH